MAYQNYQQPINVSRYSGIAFPIQQASQSVVAPQQVPTYTAGQMYLQPLQQHAATTSAATCTSAKPTKDKSTLFIIMTVLAMVLSIALPTHDMKPFFILGIFPLAISLQYRKACKLNLVHQIPHECKCARAALIAFCTPVALCLLNCTATLIL